MAEANYTVVPSYRFRVALPDGDSTASAFTNYAPQAASPELDPLVSTGSVREGANGTWGSGPESATPMRVYFLPVARQAAPGQQFGVRLWGWHRSLQEGRGGAVWVPVPVVELLATLGDAQGVPGGEDEGYRYATNVTAADGSLGPLGEVLQFQNTTAFPAAVLVELRGVERWTFDFQAQPDSVPMNALWARM